MAWPDTDGSSADAAAAEPRTLATFPHGFGDVNEIQASSLKSERPTFDPWSIFISVFHKHFFVFESVRGSGHGRCGLI